jgi:hypothetical protein
MPSEVENEPTRALECPPRARATETGALECLSEGKQGFGGHSSACLGA